MSQKDIRDKLAAAVEYLTANPAEAAYTDSAAVARIADPQGLKVEVTGDDGARMTTDMPASVGGASSAPSPGWDLRAAEASCVATLVAMRAAQQGVAYDRLEVTVDSDSDDRGILGISEDVPAGPLRTRVRVRIGEALIHDEDDNVWESIVKWAVEHCPVTDAIRRAVPLTVEVMANEEG
jgi:uncharacterized OsmC-like protein